MRKVVFYMMAAALLSGCNARNGNIMQIEEQGSFAVGGTVLTDSLGRTYHGDHAYVFYQKPVDARKYPLVFAHGVGQFSKTWETTPDGREGFQNIFLRRGFQTYLVDQPRRGGARHPQPLPPSSTRRRGSTVSAWASGPIISRACSSAATRRL